MSFTITDNLFWPETELSRGKKEGCCGIVIIVGGGVGSAWKFMDNVDTFFFLILQYHSNEQKIKTDIYLFTQIMFYILKNQVMNGMR